MVLQLRKITQPEQWTHFLQQHPYNYFLQTWQWGDFQHQGLGKPIYRLGFYDNDKLVGLALAIVETTRFGQFVYVPRGPVLDWNNLQLVQQALSSLINFFTQQNYFQLRLEPLVLVEQVEVVKQFAKLGFRTAVKAIQVERAWVLNLNQSEADLLKNMRKNTRYYVKRGQKLGLTVEFSTSDEDFFQFVNLLQQTSKRKGFIGIDTNYLQREFSFLKSSVLQLALAKWQGQVVAGALVAYYGQEASYLHAAMADDQNKLEPSYYLQWECIRRAKFLGLSRYNFWGVVSDQNYHPGHPGYGYSNFKKGFGGSLEVYLKPQDYVYNWLPYWLFRIQEWYRQRRDQVV